MSAESMKEITLSSNVFHESLELLEQGKVSLADPSVLLGMPGSSIDRVSISNRFSPPNDETASLEVILQASEQAWNSWSVETMDFAGMLFEIPRVQFKTATYRVRDEKEILWLCTGLLDELELPSFTTLRHYISEMPPEKRQARYGSWLLRAYEESGGARD